jgi:hypothetical protein
MVDLVCNRFIKFKFNGVKYIEMDEIE